MKRQRIKTGLSDILIKYGSEYEQIHNLHPQQKKAIQAIKDCRTSKLGGHKLECSECGYSNISYNSCRNRHCPKCQMLRQLKWVDKLQSDLLPVRYFHIVFTLPDYLRPLAYINQRIIYNTLFTSASQALKQLALNPRFLGAETGSVAVLHTWGQNLAYHPHIHMIVPAGGLDPDGMEWKNSKRNFFLPVKALSKVFRGKFVAKLREYYQEGILKIPVEEYLKDFNRLQEMLYSKHWNVYSKKAFGGPKQLISYLGRYTHRVAISNSRIISIDNGNITFRWKDYRDKNKWKTSCLTASEFIRRFLQHILPAGFYKIRYFGIFANINRKVKLNRCLQLLETNSIPAVFEGLPWQIILEMVTGKNIFTCPECKKGKLVSVYIPKSG